MEWQSGMMAQKINPKRIISCLKPRTSEIIRIDAGRKTITLGQVSHGDKNAQYTHRMSSPSHVLTSAGYIKIHRLPIIDPVCDFHFVIA